LYTRRWGTRQACVLLSFEANPTRALERVGELSSKLLRFSNISDERILRSNIQVRTNTITMKVNALLLSLFFAGITTLARAAVAVEGHSADSFHLRRSLVAGCPLDPTYGCVRIHTYVNTVCSFLCVPQGQENNPNYANYECGGCPPASPPPPPAPVPPPAPLPDTPPLSTCPVDPNYGCVRIQTYHINGECNTVCVPEARVGNPEYAYYECGDCTTTPQGSEEGTSSPQGITCPMSPTGCVLLHYFVNNNTLCQAVCVAPDQVNNPFFADYECGGCSTSSTSLEAVAEQQGSSAMVAGYAFSGLSMIVVSTVLAFS